METATLTAPRFGSKCKVGDTVTTARFGTCDTQYIGDSEELWINLSNCCHGIWFQSFSHPEV